jgi:hypothetical protein
MNLPSKDLGAQTLGPGELPRTAEEAPFAVVRTTDQDLRPPKNLAERTTAIVVFGNLKLIATGEFRKTEQLHKVAIPGK